MVFTVNIPALGSNMERGRITSWLFNNGDKVKEGDAIATIETDKTSYDISALGSGFLKIFHLAGEEIPVGGVIGIICSSMEEYDFATPEKYSAQSSAEAIPLPPTAPEEPKTDYASPNMRVSGIARKLASDHGLDLSKITGTGPAGRITKEDVERAMSKKEIQPPCTQMSKPSAGQTEHSPGDTIAPKVKQAIPLSGKKMVMAKRLQESMQMMAQMTNWESIDMSQLIQMKDFMQSKLNPSDGAITYTDIFVKFTALALKEYPLLNASLKGEQIIIWEDINIGVAVAMGEETDDLVVPVIRNAEKKSIREISTELRSLVKKARENTISYNDLSGGTISITNIGAFGANPGTPIIQLPQSAVVGFGAIEKKPVVVNDEIVIRPKTLLAVSVDHRFITGAVSARFRKRLKTLLENPMQILMDMK